MLYLKQTKKPKPEWLFKNIDLEKDTFFLSRQGKWQCNSLPGCLSSDLKKLPVGLFHSFTRLVCGISLVIGMDFMMLPSLGLAGRLWPPNTFTQGTDELLQSNAFQSPEPKGSVSDLDTQSSMAPYSASRPLKKLFISSHDLAMENPTKQSSQIIHFKTVNSLLAVCSGLVRL